MIPYTYHIFHRPTQQHYYGVKFARDADPELFWKTYFTSSDKVKILIEQYGIKSFDVSIRRTFYTAKEAILWETKFLNKIDDKIKTFSKPHNDITKQKIAESRTGICHSTLTKDKISKAHKGKTWRIVDGKRKWFDKENI